MYLSVSMFVHVCVFGASPQNLVCQSVHMSDVQVVFVFLSNGEKIQTHRCQTKKQSNGLWVFIVSGNLEFWIKSNLMKKERNKKQIFIE